MNQYSRFLPAGTILVCPCCGKEQAFISVDIYPDQSLDWRVIVPKEQNAILGVSSCCNERYITFEGLFSCDFGAY
jgi:hypothetical protein